MRISVSMQETDFIQKNISNKKKNRGLFIKKDKIFFYFINPTINCMNSTKESIRLIKNNVS